MWLHMRLLEGCNLKCKHCYAVERSRNAIMDYDVFKKSIDIFSEKVQIRPFDFDKRVYLSGGEPFLHKDFKSMLKYVYDKNDINGISILTNGILIPDFLDFLLNYKDKLRIQISIEGGKVLDNDIRGNGHFEKAFNSLKLLEENGFDFHISYTISKDNMQDYKKIINLAKRFKSKRNNMSPYIGDTDKMLSFSEWEDFKKEVRNYAAKINHTPVASPSCCGWTYNCAAFMGGITINPDGSLTGCARDNRPVANYTDLDKFFITSGYYMYSTCMRNKWKDSIDEVNKVIQNNAMNKKQKIIQSN